MLGKKKPTGMAEQSVSSLEKTASTAMGQLDSTAFAVDTSVTDSLSVALLADSLLQAQNQLRADSLLTDSLAKNSDIETTVTYIAQDSTIKDIDGKTVHLYGNAEVTYGAINLKAHYIRLNWVENEIYAEGRYDSTSKKMEGEPIFQDGAEVFNTKGIRYNFKTKKGIIQGIVTQQGEGNIRGQKVKKDEEGNMYLHRAMYTTCTMEHPHFHINAPRIKLVDAKEGKQKQVVSGPFNLVISDVPLPLGLPFGFFPFPKQREIGTSGIIMPSYGEEPNGRGFFLRDGGYYFAISERINAIVTGQIYSTGSWGIGAQSTYIKRYRHSGSFNFRYNRNRSGDEIDKMFGKDVRNDFSLTWSHSPVPRGSSNFSANVNMSSGNYNQFNSLDLNKITQNAASSSVQYNKTFGQYARASASFRVNQNFGQINPTTQRRENGKTNASTNFNFGINQIAPFALKGGRGRWYDSFRFGMDFNGSYSVNNALAAIDTSYQRLQFKIKNEIDTNRIGRTHVVPFNMDNLSMLLGEGQFTGRYSIPISLPNFKLFRFINLTPNVGFQGEVFTRSYDYKYVGNNTIRIDTVNRLGTQYSYSFGTSMNTRFYGLFHFKGKRLNAIRHTVIPSLAFSYTPDFSGEKYGFEQRVQINDQGDFRTLSRYRGIGSGGVGGSRASGNISFGINNSLEMKLRSKSDTSETQFEKKTLLDNFGITGSYNLLADSLNLSNINVNANTRIGNKLSLNLNMNFDPYAYEEVRGYAPGRKTNDFAFTKGQGLANMQNLNLALSTNFSPQKKKRNTEQNQTKTGLSSDQLEFIDRNPDLYVDFDMPWNINLQYAFGVTKPGLSNAQLIQTLGMTGDVSLTPKWKLTVQSGLDFTAMKPSITTLSIYRDLHCWDMSISWTPFAGSSYRGGNYMFTLKAKSSILQDLKLTRRRSVLDQGGF